MNAKFTMLFKSKKEREEYIKLANREGKSLGAVVRELLATRYLKNGANR